MAFFREGNFNTSNVTIQLFKSLTDLLWSWISIHLMLLFNYNSTVNCNCF